MQEEMNQQMPPMQDPMQQAQDPMQQNVARMASRALGEPPQKDTPMDKTNTAGAPKNEADKMDSNPISYKVKFGEGDERTMTPEQIVGMNQRYEGLLNMKEYMNPILNLAADAMERNPGMTPQDLVNAFVQMSNRPTHLGGEDARPNQQGHQAPQTASDISAQFDSWEKENAATLPPGYKDMYSMNQSMQWQMQQMMAMMQQLGGKQHGQVEAARIAGQQQRSDAVNTTKQKIANNLNTVQSRLGLTDDKAEDFMMFAAERGYTMTDFIDPNLTMRVATDFKNNLNSPEMDRLMNMARNRQAYTGMVASQPNTGGAAPAGDANLENMINRAMNKMG